MSHPPETSLSSRELAQQIAHLSSLYNEPFAHIAALIDAWVRVREREGVAIALGAILTQLTSGSYCRHDSREIVGRALATARKQLEELK